MNKKLIEAVGWYGFFGVFLGYLLVSFNFVNPTSLLYIILNFTGSIGLGILSLKKKAWSLTVFYFIWALVSIVKTIVVFS